MLISAIAVNLEVTRLLPETALTGARVKQAATERVFGVIDDSQIVHAPEFEALLSTCMVG